MESADAASPQVSDAEDGDAQGFPVAGVQDFMHVDTRSASKIKQDKKLKKKLKSGGFESLGLSPPIYQAIKKKGYRVPTPIQRKTLPLILAGHDVVAMARTGSGKTAAFLIPMLEKLRAHSPKSGARALILSPTRELALQTFKFCKELGRNTDLKITVLVGGDSMESQFEELTKNPDILIATPGRLMHHLSEVEGMSLKTVEYVVFDEADRLFEMGFAEQLKQILSQLHELRQTLLFSATLPRLLADFAKAGLKDPCTVRLDTETKISPDLKLAFFTMRKEEKVAALVHLLREVISSEQQTVVFVSTKHHVEFLNELLRSEGIDLAVVYGDMDQAARKINVAKFRARKTMILLVTDVAARGIDIPLLDNVVNYDFPAKPKLFVHRVGRAARAGRTGTAYSFLTTDEIPYLLDLHLFLSKPVRPAPTEEDLASSSTLLQETETAVSRGETVYGRFPQSVLDSALERMRDSVDQNSDLTALQKACTNAYRLYFKTRPAASQESCKRAKGLAREGMHPLFRKQVGSLAAAAAVFTERLKSFKPKQTVLEAEAEAAKAKNKKVPIVEAVEIMKRKREMHERYVKSSQQGKENEKPSASNQAEAADEGLMAQKKRKKTENHKKLSNSFRDEEFYISSVPSNRHSEMGLAVDNADGFGRNRLDTEVLDLVPDDEAGVQKQRATYHWDKKSKKYIKLNRGETITASGKIKTESGAKVNAGNRGLYKKWTERSHMKVSKYDNEEDDGNEERNGQRNRKRKSMDRNQSAGRKRRKEIPNANVRNELRGVEEVRKSRQQKAKRQLRQQGGGKKGGKKQKGMTKGGRKGKKH